MTNVDITGNTVSNVITGVVLNAGSAPPLAAGVTMDVDVTGNSISATTNAIFVRDLHDGHPNGPVTFVGLDVTGNTVTQGVVQIGRAETFVPSGASGAGNGLLNVTGTTNINGSGTADIVQVEGSGAVNFTGGEGADSFNGSSGNDSINGGGGNDTFISSGARAAYTAAWNAATSTVTLTDNRVGMDGTDTITNVESFVFADSTLSLAALLANASNRAPVVAAQNVTVGFGQSVLASSMISSASDPDAGDFITKYAFKDLGSGGGYFQVNGVTQTAGQWFEVATANLSTVRYFAGSASGSETIQIGVNDGDMWSPTVASVATSIGNRAPVVTAQNVTVSLGQSVLASSMIASSSDPDAAFGDAITKYAFKDLGSGGGYFQVNGVTQTAGQWFEVATANLSTVRYFGSSTAGTETIQIGAHDGDAWSPTVASVATSVGNRAPVVTAQNVSVQIGQSVLASTMIASSSDPDAAIGDAITKFAFKDLGSGGGYFQVNGVTQTTGQWFEVATADLATVRYFGGSAAGSETIQIGAHDGDAWSPTVASVATSLGNRAPVVTAQNVSVTSGQSILPSSMIASSSDPDVGDAITKFAFRDLGTGGGYFTVNGNAQTAGQWFEVSAADLATVRYFGGSSAGSETIYVGAHDGDAWSPSAILTATTSALLS